MEKNKNLITSIIAVLVLAGGAFWYIADDLSGVKEYNEVSEIGTTTTDNTGVVTDGERDYAIETIPITNDLPSAPNLNRGITFDASFSEDARLAATQNINELVSTLKKNVNNLDAWINLGTYRKIIGDFEGALQAWEYAGKISPQNSVSFSNLGDLYGYYLKDNQKAEENFLRAIKNSPNDIYLYFKTVEFYRDVMKDTEKARDIVQQGITANPDSQDLKALLNSLK